MKIGVVSIGNDSLELFRFLHKYDHEYVVYYDADARPLGDKTRSRQREIVQSGYDFLVAEGCEVVIVPPMGEIVGVGEKTLPIYKEYVMRCFGQSLVGKIGYLAESGQMADEKNMMQEGLMKWASEYQRSDVQMSTKQFQRPMARWGRDVRQWKYFLRSLSPRNYMVNKVVKFDVRKFKDYDVDTVLPTEWSHFAMEKTIERFFNGKRTKWGGLKMLEEVFMDLCHSALDAESSIKLDPESSSGGLYSVTIYYKGDKNMLDSSQKYLWLMGRGKSIDIIYKELDE